MKKYKINYGKLYVRLAFILTFVIAILADIQVSNLSH